MEFPLASALHLSKFWLTVTRQRPLLPPRPCRGRQTQLLNPGARCGSGLGGSGGVLPQPKAAQMSLRLLREAVRATHPSYARENLTNRLVEVVYAAEAILDDGEQSLPLRLHEALRA